MGTPATTPPGFFAGINSREGGQLLSLAANSFQVIATLAPYLGSAGALLGGLVGGEGPSTQDVVNAIDRLAEQLEVDFSELGNLILRQIQLVLQNENAIALADALAHSGTAMDHLTNLLRTGQDADLQAALNESDLGIQFFLGLPATGADPGQASQTQPYFLPGMTKAGTARVLALMARDGRELWRVDEDIVEVTGIIALLQGMIDSIEDSVSTAHIVRWGKVLNAADPEMWGYFHQEHGRVLQFFWVRQSAADAAEHTFNQQRVAEEHTAAKAARAYGISAELEFMGIPRFQALIDAQWKAAITNPILGVTDGFLLEEPTTTRANE